MNVREIYDGSDGDATKLLYEALLALDRERLAYLKAPIPHGLIAMNLLRTVKASSRAKLYRGGIRGQGSYKGMAYAKKNWSLQQLCEALSQLSLSFPWGWKEDPAQEFHKWVLYIELPTGQVSFHSATPLTAHRYAGEWDGAGISETRIIAYAQAVLEGRRPTFIAPPPKPVIPFEITATQQCELFG